MINVGNLVFAKKEFWGIYGQSELIHKGDLLFIVNARHLDNPCRGVAMMITYFTKDRLLTTRFNDVSEWLSNV